jgi:hypothetical protein
MQPGPDARSKLSGRLRIGRTAIVAFASARENSAANPGERIHLVKFSEPICNYIRVRQARFHTLVEEAEDRAGKCSA